MMSRGYSSSGQNSSTAAVPRAPAGPQALHGPQRYYDQMSVDSQFTDEAEEELSFLEACIDCDDDALYEIIQNGVTWDQVNERDKSGRTGLSHACANGFMPILELLADVEDVDPNLADNDGNTPLIFASQAGHDDVVNFMLRHFRHVKVDQYNTLGFTALLKAAIQGRTRCAKLLLFAGANPNRRDWGRGLCAEEWARFCGCHNTADAISKYIHSKKYFFKKTFILSKERCNSEPDLAASHKTSGGEGGKSRGGGGSWFQRHLSLKRKKSTRDGDGSRCRSSLEDSVAATNRSGSVPLLITISPPASPPSASKTFRRPSCIDGVVACSIIPRFRVTDHANKGRGQPGAEGGEGGNPSTSTIPEEEPLPQPPPKITVEND